MRELRFRRAQRAVNQNLLGRVRKVIGAAHHMGNAHVEIVGYNAEVVSGMTIRAEQNKVFNFLVLELKVAEDLVVKAGAACGRNSKPERPGMPCAAPLLAFLV